MLVPSVPDHTPSLPLGGPGLSFLLGHLFTAPRDSLEKRPHCTSQAVLFIPHKKSGVPPDFLPSQLWPSCPAIQVESHPSKSPESSMLGSPGGTATCLKGQSHGKWPKQGLVPPVPPEGLVHRLSECWPQMMQPSFPSRGPRGLTIKRPVELTWVTLRHLPVCLSVPISCSQNSHGGRGDSERGPPALPAAAVQTTSPSLTI